MHKNRLQNSESNEAAKYRKENATQVNAFISATTRNNRFQMQWQYFLHCCHVNMIENSCLFSTKVSCYIYAKDTDYSCIYTHK